MNFVLVIFCTVFILTQVADVITTVLAINAGAGEGNPVIKALIEKLGLIPSLLLIKFLVLFNTGFGVYYLPEYLITIILGIASVLYVAVCINNFLVFRKQR